MSLNPSNLIAARANLRRAMFPNLAQRKPELTTAHEIGQWASVCGRVDMICLDELAQAGIGHEPSTMPADFLRQGEVPFGYVGSLCMWGFTHAWYYWVAEGPGIPADRAEEFHKTWGKQCRVNGHCGCPSPLEQNHGFAVGTYHIDTQDGLNAFSGLLSSIYVKEKP